MRVAGIPAKVANVKLSLIALSALALFGSVMTFACSDDPSTLDSSDSDKTNNTPLATKDSTTATPPSTSNKTPSSSSSSSTTAKDAGTTATKPATTNTECSKETNQLDCAKCCGVNNNPINACACGASSKCAADCKDDLCAGQAPGIQCGLCLIQANCDIGLGGGGGNGGNDDPSAAAQACMTQSACSSKPAQ